MQEDSKMDKKDEGNKATERERRRKQKEREGRKTVRAENHLALS